MSSDSAAVTICLWLTTTAADRQIHQLILSLQARTTDSQINNYAFTCLNDIIGYLSNETKTSHYELVGWVEFNAPPDTV